MMRADSFNILLAVAAVVLPTCVSAQTQPASTQAATGPALGRVPIAFVRSGQKIIAPLRAVNIAYTKCVLQAYGRAWSPAVAPKDLKAEFTVPAVRVPTVFSIVPAEPADVRAVVLGEVVAYPAVDVKWDKKITLYACEAPAWFTDWAGAIGLPVTGIKPADLAAARLAPAEEKGSSLLIVGIAAAGKELSEATKLSLEKKVNVLVLDADWFGQAAGPVSVSPAQMLGALTGMSSQRWPHPLKFASHPKPWNGIANRWAWIIDEDGLPLVETIAPFSEPRDAMRPVLTSYVPWAQQLGRDESADSTLQELLAQAAKASLEQVEWRRLELIYPAADKLDVKNQPVLWAASHTPVAWKDVPSAARVVDLRGPAAPPEDLQAQLKTHTQADATTAPESPMPLLVIMGDDKVLDDWDWLKLDRTKKTIKRTGVVWLSDDTLPPSADSQIRLMLKLTEMGVPLHGLDQRKGVDRP